MQLSNTFFVIEAGSTISKEGRPSTVTETELYAMTPDRFDYLNKKVLDAK